MSTVVPPKEPVSLPEPNGWLSWLGIVRKRILWEVKPEVPRRRRRASSVQKSPMWVRAFVGGGRPLVAVIVMVMCAPGEHHLAVLAGWDPTLAWGMAAVLACYAGIAAAVAGERRKGEPGHVTAVVGALVSLLLAMAAQPVSHLFVTGWLSAEPRAPWQLVVFVSCAPAPVLGHLLHLAATPRAAAVPEVSPPVPPVPPGYMNTAELAEHLGISASAVNSRVHRGTLVPVMKDPTLGNLFDPANLGGKVPVQP
jgi:MFS family permease